MVDTPFPLGRHQEHDPASRAFPFAPTQTATITAKTWRRYGAVLDQGQLGSCTGNAFVHAMNSKPNHAPGTKPGDEALAVKVYSAATIADEYPGQYPPDDTGSSALGIGKAATALGLIREYRWAFGLDHVLATLMDGPIMCGTPWHQDMFYPDSNGFVKPTGQVVGGHEYLLCGVNPKAQTLAFQNSWSALWGIKGRFHMTFTDFASLLADGGDAMIPVH